MIAPSQRIDGQTSPNQGRKRPENGRGFTIIGAFGAQSWAQEDREWASRAHEWAKVAQRFAQLAQESAYLPVTGGSLRSPPECLTSAPYRGPGNAIDLL